MKLQTSMVCEKCGGTEVTRDGLLKWNGEAWEMSAELDCTQCDDCGEVDLVEIAVKGEPEVAPVPTLDEFKQALADYDSAVGRVSRDREPLRKALLAIAQRVLA